MIDWSNPVEARTMIERINKVLHQWEKKGHVAVSEVRRIVNGDFNYFGTFAKNDSKSGANRHGYAVIAGAATEEDALSKFTSVYPKELVGDLIPEWEFDGDSYAEGELERIEIDKGDDDKREKVTLDQ